MKKEIIIAILVGLIFGLIITYGIYRMRIALTRESTNVSISATPIPTPSASSTSLTLFSPEDRVIQEQKELTISGSTIPDSYVVLFVNNEDYVSTADQTGNFSFNVILEIGSNILKVYSVDGNGTTTTIERTVIVDSGQPTVSTASATPTASARPSTRPTVRPSIRPTPSPSAAP